MSLIKKPKKEVFVPLTVKLEQGLSDKLKRYAEFLECTQAHIVACSIAYAMKADKDFAQRESETPQKKAAAQ